MSKDNWVAGEDRRQTGDRYEIDCRVRIKPRDRNYFDSTIKDLSASGFRVNCPADLTIGSSLLVELPGLEDLPAIVRWKSGFLYGCAFARNLHFAVLDHIIAQSRSS